MANKQRGEVDVTIAGKIYPMRPSLDAIARIEGATNLGILAVFQRIRSGNYGMRDAEPIIREGIKAAEVTPPDNLAELIYADGVMTFLPPICLFIANALNGGKEGEQKSGEAPAVA